MAVVPRPPSYFDAALPLVVLERKIDSWIVRKKG